MTWLPAEFQIHNRLGPLRVGGLAVLFRPTVAVPRRVVHPAALNDDGSEIFAVAEDARLVVFAPTVLAFASPLADITVFNDDMMSAEESDSVLLYVLDGEAAEDDVARADRDADVICVARIDRAARSVVQHIGIRPPGVAYGKRRVAVRDLNHGLHGEFLAPGSPSAFDSPIGPFESQGNIVGRSRRQVHETTAVVGLAFWSVYGPVT